MCLLETKGLSHKFSNGTFGIQNANFKINKGEFIAITGPNGSGKTVFVKHFNRLLSPTEGEVLFNGINIKKDIHNIREKIGFIL